MIYKKLRPKRKLRTHKITKQRRTKEQKKSNNNKKNTELSRVKVRRAAPPGHTYVHMYVCMYIVWSIYLRVCSSTGTWTNTVIRPRKATERTLEIQEITLRKGTTTTSDNGKVRVNGN